MNINVPEHVFHHQDELGCVVFVKVAVASCFIQEYRVAW